MVRVAAERGSRLSFAEQQFDRVQIRAVGQQEPQAGAARLDGLADASDFVAAEIIGHHDVAWRQRRGQELLDPAQERGAVDGAVQHQRGHHAIVPEPQRTVVVCQCPWGTAAVKRWPRGARPRVRAMLAVVQISSRNTSFVTSGSAISASQAARASTMSARSCSAARRRFLERQAQSGQGLPHRRVADRAPVLACHPRPQLRDRRVRLFGHPRPQCPIERRQTRLDLVVPRPRRRLARLAEARPRLRNMGRTDAKPCRHHPNRTAARQHPIAQVLPARTPPPPAHRCLRPMPDASESQDPPVSEALSRFHRGRFGSKGTAAVPAGTWRDRLVTPPPAAALPAPTRFAPPAPPASSGSGVAAAGTSSPALADRDSPCSDSPPP